MLASGERWTADSVIAFVAPGEGGAAFVAGRRIGKAVQRNRARRVLKAAWGGLAGRVREDQDVVLVARKTILGAGSPEIGDELSLLLRRCGVLP